MTSGRDGVDFIIKNGFVETLIKSFMKFSKIPQNKDFVYFNNILSVFIEILQEDEAIIKFIGNNVFEWMLFLSLQIYSDDDYYKPYSKTLLKKILNCMGCFTLNSDGKEEGVSIKVMDNIILFLEDQDSEIVNYSLRIVMFLTIDLEGKIQFINYPEEKLM